jgi:hypothetical protein
MMDIRAGRLNVPYRNHAGSGSRPQAHRPAPDAPEPEMALDGQTDSDQQQGERGEIAGINACSGQRAIQPVGSIELAEVKAPKEPLAREHLGARHGVDC